MKLAKILLSVVSASAVVLAVGTANDGYDTNLAVVHHGMGYDASIAVAEGGVSNGPSAVTSKSTSPPIGFLIAMLPGT